MAKFFVLLLTALVHGKLVRAPEAVDTAQAQALEEVQQGLAELQEHPEVLQEILEHTPAVQRLAEAEPRVLAMLDDLEALRAELATFAEKMEEVLQTPELLERAQKMAQTTAEGIAASESAPPTSFVQTEEASPATRLLPLLRAPKADAFQVPPTAARAAAAPRASPAAVTMVDIPRLELPSAVTDALKDLDLKNPNQLSTADYNTYSAAAIGGTLALFLPGALVFDITGTIADFFVSATIGGGLGAFLALRKDELAGSVNDLGGKLLQTVGDDAKSDGGINIPRLTLPQAVVDVLKDIELKNPNELADVDYNKYSAAAIGGTLALFLPGALVFDITGTIADFLVSATIGGGLGAYLALRKDDIGDSVNELGGKLLGFLD
jgi:hypothetical protein